MKIIYALSASVILSLISLVGVVSLLFTKQIISGVIFILISFAAGSLIGASFFHIIPEVVEQAAIDLNYVFYYVIAGFIVFFILEKYLFWRHCHKGGSCEIHPVSYLNLLGDSLHNFMDGVFIGASFFVDIKIGLVSTIAVALHEIPQELGDFGVLLYSGFSVKKALFYNFLSGLTAIVGAMLGYFLSDKIQSVSVYLLPLIAGGFIYVSCCDLIPELQKERNLSRSVISLIIFLTGVIFINMIK